MRDFENATRHKAPKSRCAPPGRPGGRGLVFSKRRGCSPRDSRRTLTIRWLAVGGSRERSGLAQGLLREHVSHHSRPPSAVPLLVPLPCPLPLPLDC